MSARNIAFPIVWNLCEHLQYELVQIEWTVICRITTQKIFSDVIALYCKLFMVIRIMQQTSNL